MQHLTLFIYFLFLSSGFAGITVTLILWRRIGHAVLGWMIPLIGMFTLWLILALVGYYFESIILYPISFGPYLNVLGFFLGIVFYVCILLCVLQLRLPLRLPVLLAGTVPIVLRYLYSLLGVTMFPSLLRLSETGERIASLSSVVATAAFLVFAGFAFLAGSRQSGQDTVHFLLGWLGKMMLVFAPLAVVSSVVMTAAGVRTDPTVFLNFVFFFVWNLFAIATFVRYLVRPTALIEDGKISTGFRKEYGISNREAEIVELISHGMSNKEIASSLNVSFTTVRTHVYNIFRKTGARSRVELLRIVSGYRE